MNIQKLLKIAVPVVAVMAVVSRVPAARKLILNQA